MDHNETVKQELSDWFTRFQTQANLIGKEEISVETHIRGIEILYSVSENAIKVNTSGKITQSITIEDIWEQFDVNVAMDNELSLSDVLELIKRDPR